MRLIDVVVMIEDMPSQHLLKGQVGTIVEELDDRNVLVEFGNLDGEAYALTPRRRGDADGAMALTSPGRMNKLASVLRRLFSSFNPQVLAFERLQYFLSPV